MTLFFGMTGFLWSLNGLTILYPLLIGTWFYPEACGQIHACMVLEIAGILTSAVEVD